MPRSPGNTLRVRGPFLGLDEKTDPTILGPQYATSLNNVLLDRGKIEPRGGLKEARNLVVETPPGEPDPLAPQVLQLANVALQSDQTANAVVSVTDQGIYLSDARTVPNVVDNSDFRPDLSARGSIVPFLDHVYFMWGSEWGHRGSLRIKFEGGQTYTYDFRDIGIPAPIEISNVVKTIEQPEPPEDPIPGWPAGSFELAISLARIDDDGVTLVESNRTIDPAGAAHNLVWQQIRLTVKMSLPDSGAWNSFKLYVKTLAFPEVADFAEESTFRLAAVIRRDAAFVTEVTAGVEYEIVLREAQFVGLGLRDEEPDIVLSTTKNGPFAPTRNGQPPAARIATAYQDMMMYASVERGTKGLLFYSQPGNPNHVAGLDFLSFGDRVSTNITALVVYQGRLIIFKGAEIYVLAGTIQRESNAHAALNPDGGIEVTFQIFKVLDGIGCANTDGGIGALECDAILYFNGADGIYAFNGLSAVKVSAALDATFFSIPTVLRKQCTMANDTDNGLLWIYYAHPDVASRWTMLCYDYRHLDPRTRLGAWTVHDFDTTRAVALLSITSARPIAERDLIVATHKSFVGGTMGGKIVYGKRTVPLDLTAGIPWNYTTAPLDLGLAERNKRFHYLSVEHTMEDGSIGGRVLVESGRGERTIDFSFRAQDSKVHKVRIGSRGSRVAVRFAGTRHQLNEDTPAINGFAIDAEPIGHR